MAQDQRARQIPLHIAEAEPHPQAADIVKEIDVDKISNQQVHRFLNLKEGYNIMDNLEKKFLESYFGLYSRQPNHTEHTTDKIPSPMKLRNSY